MLIISNGLCRKNMKFGISIKKEWVSELYSAIRLTQSQNDSINSLVCSYCPKRLFCGMHGFLISNLMKGKVTKEYEQLKYLSLKRQGGDVKKYCWKIIKTLC